MVCIFLTGTLGDNPNIPKRKAVAIKSTWFRWMHWTSPCALYVTCRTTAGGCRPAFRQKMFICLAAEVTSGWPCATCSPSDCRSEEHTSELQSRPHLVCRLLLEKKNNDRR